MQEPVSANYKIESFPQVKVKTTSQVLYVIDGMKAGVKPAHLRPLECNSKKTDKDHWPFTRDIYVRPLGKIQGKRNRHVGWTLKYTLHKLMNWWIKYYFYFHTPKELYKFNVARIYELLLSFGDKETWSFNLEAKPSSQIPTAQGHTGNKTLKFRNNLLNLMYLLVEII